MNEALQQATIHQVAKDYGIAKSRAKKIVGTEPARYDDYVLMIYERAWHWAKSTGWEVDELVSEGNLKFAELAKRHNEAKSSFSTFLYNGLENHYKRMYRDRLKRQKRQCAIDSSVDPDSMPGTENQEDWAALKEMIGHLSKDAHALAKCALETPKGLVKMFAGQAIHVSASGILQKYFLKKGWNIGRFLKAADEVRLALASLDSRFVRTRR